MWGDLTFHLGSQLRRCHGEGTPPFLVLCHHIRPLPYQVKGHLLILHVGSPVQWRDALLATAGIHSAAVLEQGLDQIQVAHLGSQKQRGYP